MLQKEKLYSVKADAQSLLLSPMIIEDHYVTAYEANMVLYMFLHHMTLREIRDYFKGDLYLLQIKELLNNGPYPDVYRRMINSEIARRKIPRQEWISLDSDYPKYLHCHYSLKPHETIPDSML